MNYKTVCEACDQIMRPGVACTRDNSFDYPESARYTDTFGFGYPDYNDCATPLNGYHHDRCDHLA